MRLLFNMYASDDGPIELKHVGHVLCNKWSFNYYMLYFTELLTKYVNVFMWQILKWRLDETAADFTVS
jgi:hypothetical protein